jgi:acyl-homoserine-lactone acylase
MKAIARAILVVVLPAAAACAPSGAPAPPVGSPVQVASEGARGAGYEATIRRTGFGVAHIEAPDLGSLGFGEGYAQAEDHLCSIADQVVRARGERAMYLGRGDGDRHLASDLTMRALRVPERAAEMLATQPAEIRDWLAGFAAGYNRYLAETGSDAVPGWCRGQDWVVPISAADLAAYHRLLALVISNFAGAIATAQPPGPAAAGPAGAARSTHPDAAAAGQAAASGIPGARWTASNAWALGRELTEGGRGMLLANPHYPWIGSNRFWEKHLRIPGDLEVYGVNLLGVPGVLVGFTAGVGWTHTVSAGTRYTLYAVELVPGDPTRYRYGGEERAMRPLEVVVAVRGEAEPVRRTLWSTHHGPVMSTAQMQWTDQRAFALRDANEDNDRLAAHILAANRASSLADLQRAHAEHQALPWVNTIAVSPDGVAWYMDAAATPHLGAHALADWLRRRESDPFTRQLWQSGMVLLPGSDPRSEWQGLEAGGRGIVPFRDLPQLERTDYVFNANDSFWLAHGDTMLEGAYSPLHGEQRAPVSLRTRNNILHLSNATPDRPAGAHGRFSLRALQHAILSNRSLAADLLAPALVERCSATPRVAVDGGVVELVEACAVLAAWDHRFDLESRGAVLFREWIGQYSPADLQGSGALFAVDFDPADPVNTPRGLAAGGLALENLAKAVAVLEGRDLALDAPLGELQYAPSKLPRRIPLHGGNGSWEGLLNLMQGATGATTLEPVLVTPRVQGSRFLTHAGYPVLHGTSFLMALEFTDDGPQAMAVLTYGQSGDPESEHFADQTLLFSRKEWRPVLFTPEAIAAGTRRQYTVRGAAAPAEAVVR